MCHFCGEVAGHFCDDTDKMCSNFRLGAELLQPYFHIFFLILFIHSFTQFYTKALTCWPLHFKPMTSILQPEQSEQRTELSFVITSFIFTTLHFSTLSHTQVHFCDGTLIHVALNQHSTSINSLGEHSQLFPLFSESDIALLLENEHSDPRKKTTLNCQTCTNDGFLHLRNILQAFNEHTQPLCQITERLPASSCLRARLAE